MNIPGFTAEVSLRRNGNRHYLTESSNDVQHNKVVTPQLPRVLDCFCFRSWSYCCCRGEDGKWVCGASQSA